jgi:hypothetical protein
MQCRREEVDCGKGDYMRRRCERRASAEVEGPGLTPSIDFHHLRGNSQMTNAISANDIDKHFDNSKIEGILVYFIDSNRICKICVQDHVFKPTLEGVTTRIDGISELFRTKKIIDGA